MKDILEMMRQVGRLEEHSTKVGLPHDSDAAKMLCVKIFSEVWRNYDVCVCVCVCVCNNKLYHYFK